MMHGPEKSDLLVIPKKPVNKAGRSAAESVEGRSETKGNAELQSTVRTQSRVAVSQAQRCIREAVTRNGKEKLTALLHHMSIDVLRSGFLSLKKRAAAGVDALGYYGPPYAYARMQVLENAIATTKSLDQKVLADYLHKAHIPTILGDMAFGPDGERPKPLAIFVQYRGIVGHDLAQFKKPGREVIVYPPALKSGDFQYPFAATAQ